MTNDEILEAKKLIADMRNVLSDLAGSAEPETKADMESLLYKKMSRLADTNNKLIGLVGSTDSIAVIRRVLVKFWDKLVFNFLAHNDKEKLSDITAKYAPIISSALDKIAQELKQPPNPKAGG